MPGVRLIWLERGIDQVDLDLDSAAKVGRKATCAVIVPEEYGYVSGEHCCVHISADGDIVIEDLSANGTFVNSARIGKGLRLAAQRGDEVALAKPNRKGGVLKFQIEVQARSTDPADADNRAVPELASPTTPHKQDRVAPQPTAATPTAATPTAATPTAATPVASPMATPLATPSPSEHAAALLQAATPLQAVTPLHTPSPRRADPAQVLEMLTAERDTAQKALRESEQRCEAEVARATAIASEIGEVRQLVGQERGRRMAAETFRRDLAAERDKLSERCTLLHIEVVEGQQELSFAKDAAVRRRELFQAQLDAEKVCTERAELRAAELRSEAKEASAELQPLQRLLQVAAQRSDHLEQRLAQAGAGSANSRQFEDRTAAFLHVKVALREHVLQVADRLGCLEPSLLELELPPADSTCAAKRQRISGSERCVEQQ